MENETSPKTIYIHVTRACNQDCLYCYFSAGKPMSDELYFNEMLPVFDDIQQLNPQKVVFTGGEPLLRSDIFELAHAFREADKKHHIRLSIISNGTLINENNAKDLVESFDEIRISIDGFKQVNDIIRGKGTFDKAVNALDVIQRMGGNPIASVTVTSLNITTLKEFLSFLLHRKRICDLHLSAVKLIGNALNRTDLMCHTEEIKQILAEFWYESFGIRSEHDSMDDNSNKNTFNCGVGTYLTVYPNGSVYPCHLLAFPEFCIGNVKKQGLYSIYNQSSLMHKLKNLHFREIAQSAECFKELSREGTCLGVLAQERNFRKQLHNLFSGETNVDAPEFPFGGP